MKFEHGYLRARNDTLNQSLYFSDFGISTFADATGENNASGTLAFRDTTFGDDAGLTVHSTWGAVALQSEYNRIVLEAQDSINLESKEASVYIRPFRDTRVGNNAFNFWVKENEGVGATDGVIYYGSDVNGYGSGLRFSKSASGGSKVYATNGNGDMGTGHFVAETFRGALMTETENAYVMVDTSMRVTDKNGYNNGSPNYRDLQARDIQSNTIRVHTDATRDFYIGVSTNEARVTNNLFYNGGNTGYRPIRASEFIPASSVKYKDNITLFEESGTEIIKDHSVYTYHLKSDLEAGIYDNKQIGFIAESSPMLRNGDGISQYKAISINWKATQELIQRIEQLEQRLNELETVV
jgi:hypothetical protein